MVLIKVENDILMSMDRQQITALVALDLSAAFDTVDHKILLSVLEKTYGVKGGALQWIRDYLKDRKTKVRINDRMSREMDLPFSVPQGSCGGPVLYNLYASTLGHSIDRFNIGLMGYADDHILYDSFEANSRSQEQNCIQNLEECLDKTKSWMDQNRLKMNCTKTEFTMFGNQVQLRKCDTKNIAVNEERIEATKTFKYLGVTLDDNLTLKPFIKEKCKKCNFNLKNIREIRKYLSQKTCEQLVNALVTSTLDYGNGLLAKLPQSTLRPLQIVQNRAAKMVLQRSRDSSSTEARKTLHWLPVEARVRFKTLSLAHHCIHKEAPEYLCQMFKKNEPKPYNLRSDTNLYHVPTSRCKSFGDRAFSVNGPISWNSLPKKIQEITDFKLFKKELKTHLFQLSYN
jgi:hypothetical protein